jgi:L-malate glycosyltransferase
MTRFAPGGTERQMTELIRRLDPERFTVHVACFHREGAWLPRIAERAASIVEFPIDGFARPATAKQFLAFARWCRRERIAVVQTCDLYANIFGLPGAALAGVPVRIGSRRELNPDKTAWQIRLQRFAYRFATKVVANSPAARHMLESEGLSAGSIAVIPNGLDLAAFVDRPPRTEIRTVLTVANLRPEKNHQTLIDAASVLVRTHPELRFQFAGDGPERQVLEERARTRDVASHIEFLLPSRSEAFPNGAIEAMAAGLPIVASAVGGLVDLIESGRTGLLVPPSDPEALLLAISSLIEKPAWAADLGRAARLEVQHQYSFDRMLASFEELYTSGLEQRTSTRTHHAEAAGI